MHTRPQEVFRSNRISGSAVRSGILFIFFLLGTGCFSTLSAKEVPEKTAGRVGINFFYERVNRHLPVTCQDIRVLETYRFKEGAQTVYYLFNLSPSGFVAVSADDRVKPVLAYSFDGKYSETDPAPQFKAWMAQYARQIRFAVESGSEATRSVRSEWEQLETDDPGLLSPLRTDREVLPLLNSSWNQNAPYNGMCPADPAGPGGHVYAGCVPTAMAQLMYYYRWPETGTGSYSYEDPPYGTLSVNYDSAHYDWNAMRNSTLLPNEAIEQLLYHLGVSCDLQYGPGGSGMYNHKAAYAWRTFFKYSPQTQYIFRDSTTLDWDSILIAHLDRKMPMYYAGWSVPNIDGHAFVCDGYQGAGYFHFNFGWSGQSDGYFYTDNLTPGGNNFNLAQEVIVNCYPDTLHYQYPGYCSGNQVQHTMGGSLEDGSGPRENYRPNASCSWLLDPQTDEDSVSSVTLTFNRFSTAPGDTVKVYDGSTAEAPLLGAWSGSTLPGAVTGTGNRMLVTFTSGSGPSSEGWFATWSATNPIWCNGMKTITADTLDLSDGSYRFNYHNNTACRWKVYNTTGNPLTLNFRSFDTEDGKDLLQVYDLATMDTLARISGHYDSTALPPPVTSQSGSFFLMFTTNSSVTGKGWEIYYPKSTAGIEPAGNLRGVRIYPNPAADRVTVSYYSALEEAAGWSVYTVNGSILGSGRWNSTAGDNVHTIDLTGISPGFYMLEVKTGTSLSRQKLIIHQP